MVRGAGEIAALQGQVPHVLRPQGQAAEVGQLDTEDGATWLLTNVANYLPVDTASLHREKRRFENFESRKCLFPH
jgi:hypothetical protein